MIFMLTFILVAARGIEIEPVSGLGTMTMQSMSVELALLHPTTSIIPSIPHHRLRIDGSGNTEHDNNVVLACYMGISFLEFTTQTPCAHWHFSLVSFL